MQPLLGGPRAGLNADDVTESLTLARGAQVQHGVDVLDDNDNLTGETLAFTSAAVTWNYRAPDPIQDGGQTTSIAAVRRQGTLNVAGPVNINLLARRLRLWTQMRLRTGGWAQWYMGVFDTVSPAVADDGNVLTQTLALSDKSYLWSQTTLTDPVHLDDTIVAVDWVKTDLGTRFGETRFAIADPGGTVGGNGLTFDSGTDCLTMYSQVLESIGYDQLTTDETGAASSQSLATIASKGIEQVYGAGAGKIVPASSVAPLVPNLPNVIRFVARQGPSSGGSEDNGIYTVYNYSTGPGSIDARSGKQVSVTVQVDAPDQATLVVISDALKQRYFAGGGQTFTGSVGLNPRHSDSDVVSIVLPRLGLPAGAAWVVTSWTYPLNALTQSSDVLMPITAEMRVT